MRTEWIERESFQRPDWDVAWTVIGGRSEWDPVAELPEDIRLSATRSLSQVMVATTPTSAEAPERIRHWATTVRRLTQRGANPQIPRAVELPERPEGADAERILAAIAGTSAVHDELDPACVLDSAAESEFWTLLGKKAPMAQRWCTPQASLDRLAGTDAERWADFLFTLPWLKAAKVLEIDGESYHADRTSVDAERDRDLESNSLISVERVSPAEALDPNGSLVERLSRHEDRFSHEPTVDLLRAVHGPQAYSRAVYAIAEAVERGFLPTGGSPWSIRIEEPFGITGAIIQGALDLAASISDVWGQEIVPDRVVINGTLYERDPQRRFAPTGHSDLEPSFEIRFEPFRSAYAPLPEHDIARMVFRNVLLPVELAWTSPTSTQRRERPGTTATDAALDRLLIDLFGYAEFNEAQRDAISRLLFGKEELVLLPTGSGKTLIYQMAGLLMPGTTIIVAPLKSLIDDQERRLRELGVDRVIAIHSGKGLRHDDKRVLQEAIGAGESLFVLVAPERLQIQSFRDEIQAAAQSHLVNVAVIDEVHSLSEWGHQFRTSYLNLGRNLKRFGSDTDSVPPPFTALTATAGPRVLDDIVRDLGIKVNEPGTLHRPKSFDRPNLHYSVKLTKPKERPIAVAEALADVAANLGVDITDLGEPRGGETMSGIVFVPHRNGKVGIGRYRNVVAEALGISTDQVAVYSGDQPDSVTASDIRNAGFRNWDAYKATQAEAFRTNLKPIMVATSAFGMGIDKPNIRYTIHTTIPSSLEAFAQETGRAGRDHGDSYCVLVSALPSEAEADLLLKQARTERKQEYVGRDDAVRDNNLKTDVDFQLFFQYGSFPDAKDEVDAALQVYTELCDDGEPGSTGILIPRTGSDDGAKQRERALFRLSSLGIVHDYTINYKARTFEVDLERYTVDSIDAALENYVWAATGDSAKAAAAIEAAPVSPTERVRSHLGTLLTILHESVEHGRIEALYAMYDLARTQPDDITIHSRLDAYLGAGPIAELLDRLVGNPGLSLGEATEEMVHALSDAVPVSSEEWAGAATRFVESYPDHPIVLTILALGEAWRSGDSYRRFEDLIARVIREYRASGYDDARIVGLMGWILDRLRTYDRFGDRSSWAVAVWNAIKVEHLHALDLELETLDRASATDLPAPGELELRLILANRTIRNARTANAIHRRIT